MNEEAMQLLECDGRPLCRGVSSMYQTVAQLPDRDDARECLVYISFLRLELQLIPIGVEVIFTQIADARMETLK